MKAFKRPQLIRDEVYEHLREQILVGALKPHDWLREQELSKELEVSRTPIRDALNRMVQEGLLESGTRGVRVRRYSLQEAIDIYEVRELLEQRAAYLAAQRVNEGDITQLYALLKSMHDTPSHDFSSHIKIDLSFHKNIAKLSGNEALLDLIERLTGRLISLRALTKDKIGGEHSQEQHKKIVDAIRAKDAPAAAKAMSNHVAFFKDILDERLKNIDTQ